VSQAFRQALPAHAKICGIRSRENRMKDATKKAASEALAQFLAVTAMLVIAGFVLYSH
jgi:hypothetical protein